MRKFVYITMLLLGISCCFSSCKGEPEQEPTPPSKNDSGTQITPPTNNDSGTQTTPEKPIKHKNVKLFFYDSDLSAISPDTIKKYDAMSHIDTMFLVPGSAFYDKHTPEYPTLVREILQDRMSYSNKTHGKGDIGFCRGQAAALPADSLWYIANGWTINQTKYLER